MNFEKPNNTQESAKEKNEPDKKMGRRRFLSDLARKATVIGLAPSVLANTAESSPEKVASFDEDFEEFESKIEEDPGILNISAYFKTGTTEFLSSQAEENAKQAIRNFIADTDFDNFKIVVVGTYSIERPSDRNNELAQQRKALGLQLLKSVLSETYNPEEIADIIIEDEARGMSVKEIHPDYDKMSSEDQERAKDETQGIRIRIEGKTTEKPSGLERSVFANARAILVDKSTSMKPDVEKTERVVERLRTQFNKDIDIVDIAGKDQEQHLATLHSVLSSIGQSSGSQDIFLITDEADNIYKGEKYDQKVQEVLTLARQKGYVIKAMIYNPNNDKTLKIVDLARNPSALKYPLQGWTNLTSGSK